jgi:hypothetical protein
MALVQNSGGVADGHAFGTIERMGAKPATICAAYPINRDSFENRNNNS